MTPEQQAAYDKAEAEKIKEVATASLGFDDEDLAGRIVGLLIRDEGNLNKYQRTLEFVIKLLREIESQKQKRGDYD